jgi:hypothetical protein
VGRRTSQPHSHNDHLAEAVLPHAQAVTGTTENFIDQETVRILKLGSKKLSEPVQLRNINGTYNQSGSVTHYIDLLVSRKSRKITQ